MNKVVQIQYEICPKGHKRETERIEERKKFLFLSGMVDNISKN